MSNHQKQAQYVPKTKSYSHYLLSLLRPIVPSVYTNCTITGFLALLLSTCSNYMLAPIRDATALSIGVQYIPRLTLASTFLALVSSVPIGWLFEAPDPSRRAVFRNFGLTRGETQGSSLALFYRTFAIFLFIYSFAEKCAEMSRDGKRNFTFPWLRSRFGTFGYVVFFLVVHLMKLHSISLVWGVTSEAMEYEEAGYDRRREKHEGIDIVSRVTGEKRGEGNTHSGSARLKCLAFVGFGGTLGGILGSIIVSFAIHTLRLSGLLLLASILLLMSANLSIELGNIMHKFWSEEQQILLLREQQQEQQQKEQQCNGGGSVSGAASGSNELESEAPDRSMKRVSSSSSMKRISSGNSLQQSFEMKKSASAGSLTHTDEQMADDNNTSSTSNACSTNHKLPKDTQQQQHNASYSIPTNSSSIEEDTFRQRLLRGITTILRSKLLMSIFTYNALYSSTSTLLSFKRAQLVVNDRASKISFNLNTTSSTESHTAFLAKINIISSISVFVFQITGIGAAIAHHSGMRGTLAILPLIRLLGVLFLFCYEYYIGYQTNLFLFLLLDEFCKVVNLAIAKPVRESLWRGLSAEARYEAKPIVDTLANRWGGGSAAFLVQCMNWTFSKTSSSSTSVGSKNRFGLLILCLIISAWWCMVSLHLGSIRQRIDMELKKRQ